MPRKQKKYHFIYKTTCKNTNHYYFGMHSTNNLEDGYMGSGTRISRSIKKYGKENHIMEKLEFLETREKLSERETEIINEILLDDPNCMNIAIGGSGGYTGVGELGNQKMKWLRKNDPLWVEKYRVKRSDCMKKQYVEGREKTKNWKFKGPHREEVKQKIGITNSLKQSGELNSQFGTCWITNEKKNKKIHKGNEIPEGWKLGRVQKTT